MTKEIVINGETLRINVPIFQEQKNDLAGLLMRHVQLTDTVQGNLDGLLNLLDALYDILVDKAEDAKFYKCGVCGGSDLEVRKWMDINTGRIVGDSEDGTYFCQNCEDHHKLNHLEIDL